jgi:hypothetical protein
MQCIATASLGFIEAKNVTFQTPVFFYSDPYSLQKRNLSLFLLSRVDINGAMEA